MPRYIDADKLIELATHEGAYGYVDVHDILQTPTADVVERKKGEWARDEFGSKCSCCGLYAYRDKFGEPWESDFCPNCGCDMRKEKPDDES